MNKEKIFQLFRKSVWIFLFAFTVACMPQNVSADTLLLEHFGNIAAENAEGSNATLYTFENGTKKIRAEKPSIKLNKSKATLYTTGSKTIVLKATVTGPSNKVKWKSSNKKVASVTSKGKVTARSVGKATITAKANGVSAKCLITVKKKAVEETIEIRTSAVGIDKFIKSNGNLIIETDNQFYREYGSYSLVEKNLFAGKGVKIAPNCQWIHKSDGIRWGQKYEDTITFEEMENMIDRLGDVENGYYTLFFYLKSNMVEKVVFYSM